LSWLVWLIPFPNFFTISFWKSIHIMQLISLHAYHLISLHAYHLISLHAYHFNRGEVEFNNEIIWCLFTKYSHWQHLLGVKRGGGDGSCMRRHVSEEPPWRAPIFLCHSSVLFYFHHNFALPHYTLLCLIILCFASLHCLTKLFCFDYLVCFAHYFALTH
jgi:hypothetical protein